jgi:glycosyltransferase involved in cell wall biosynthesis
LPPQNESREIDELRRSVDALGDLLRQERIRTEALRARLNQQEAQIRELQRSTRSILDSRIWKTLVRLGGQFLWLQQQQTSWRTRLLMGGAKLTGGNAEIVQFHKDTPGERAGRLSGKIRVSGWAVAPSGIDAVRVRVDEGRAMAATTGLPRADIAAIFPNHEGAASSGYRATVDLTGLAEGPHTLHIQAVSNTGATADASFSIDVGSARPVRTPFEIRSALQSMTYKPVFSILTPVYDTPEKWLRRVIDSVLQQHYPHWELCIADDCSTQPHVRKVLDEYMARDQRIKVVYRDKNGHIAEATNSALGIATGEFIALLDHDDEITPDALLENAIALNEHPELDFLYSDEDKIDEDGVYSDPFYKPDWSPDYMLTCMYTCHLGVYRTSLVREIGGFRTEVNGAQDYDLALRIAARSDRIHHIPHVLYHWRTLATSTASGAEAKNYAYPAAQRAIADYLQLAGTPGKVLDGPRAGYHRVLYDIKGKPRVSVVIPSAGRIIDWEGRQIDLLRMCVGSILTTSTWPEIEIVVIHNNDLRPDLEEWLQTRAKLVGYSNPNFNLAEKINIGARHATGDHLVIQNDDTEVIAPDWIEHMLRYSQQAPVGAVGAKLLFPDNRIQHAGVVLLNGAPGHAY